MDKEDNNNLLEDVEKHQSGETPNPDQEIQNNNTNIKQLNFNVMNLNEAVPILEEMGFDKAYANKVYYFLKPGSIEMAINYMSEEKGIIQHKFYQQSSIESFDKVNKCFICGEIWEKHMDYRQSMGNFISSTFFPRISLNRSSTKKNAQGRKSAPNLFIKIY